LHIKTRMCYISLQEPSLLRHQVSCEHSFNGWMALLSRYQVFLPTQQVLPVPRRAGFYLRFARNHSSISCSVTILVHMKSMLEAIAEPCSVIP
jgi:hypothetical protein